MNDVLKQAYDLNGKILGETEKAQSEWGDLLNQILNECINFKALIYLQSNNHSSTVPKTNLTNSIDNDENNCSKSGVSDQQTTKAKIFLSRKVKRTSKASDNLTTNKALKNNKIVYCHSDISTKESKHITDENHGLNHQDSHLANQTQAIPSTMPLATLPMFQRKNRGSIYRGVSRNGNQWQVLIMINKKKKYIGSYSNEVEAARAYDEVALQNHRRKAKTNFYYSEDKRREIISKQIQRK